MTSREQAAREALHAELEELARRPGRGPFEVRVLVEDAPDGRHVESIVETRRHVERKERRA